MKLSVAKYSKQFIQRVFLKFFIHEIILGLGIVVNNTLIFAAKVMHMIIVKAVAITSLGALLEFKFGLNLSPKTNRKRIFSNLHTIFKHILTNLELKLFLISTDTSYWYVTLFPSF